VEHASHSSHKAKLVKEADKLYNLRDLTLASPEGWTEDRVQAYFEWSLEVVTQLRGTNPQMEEALDKIFSQRGLMH